MARSTGPILAVGAVTVVNRTIVHGRPMEWRVVIATGIAAGVLALIEKGWERGAVALSYLALITVLFVRLHPSESAPVESLLEWWNAE